MIEVTGGPATEIVVDPVGWAVTILLVFAALMRPQRFGERQ